MTDEHQERIEGPSPTGAAYSIAYWQTEDGEPTIKRKARRAEVVDYDSNDQELARYYAEL